MITLQNELSWLNFIEKSQSKLPQNIDIGAEIVWEKCLRLFSLVATLCILKFRGANVLQEAYISAG